MYQILVAFPAGALDVSIVFRLRTVLETVTDGAVDSRVPFRAQKITVLVANVVLMPRRSPVPSLNCAVVPVQVPSTLVTVLKALVLALIPVSPAQVRFSVIATPSKSVPVSLRLPVVLVFIVPMMFLGTSG